MSELTKLMVEGPAGAVVTLVMREDGLDISVKHDRGEWTQTLAYGIPEMTVYRRAIGRPRSKAKPSPMTVDEVIGLDGIS